MNGDFRLVESHSCDAIIVCFEVALDIETCFHTEGKTPGKDIGPDRKRLLAIGGYI